VSELIATRIREHAERLHLAWLADNLDALVTRAEQASMGYLEFVDLALEEEVGLREGRRFRNALKLSGLPHHKGLDAFDFAFQPELDARKVRDLAALGFVEAKANVCFLGPPGVGKTMLAVAWPSPPARPASRSTSPPWTTWSATSRKRRPPGGSPRSSRPT
jgi:DNA replication protein DnaC